VVAGAAAGCFQLPQLAPGGAGAGISLLQE